MSSNCPPQLQLSIPPTSFKRTFQEYGFDLESPVGSQEAGTSVGDGHDRNKRARSASSFSDSDSSDSSQASSSTLASGSSNSLQNEHMPAISITRPSMPLSLSHSSEPPRLPTPEIQDIEMPEYSMEDRQPSEAGSPLSLAIPSPSTNIDAEFRLSLEQFETFDGDLSVLRQSRSRSPSRFSTPPPILPPLELSGDQSEIDASSIPFLRAPSEVSSYAERSSMDSGQAVLGDNPSERRASLLEDLQADDIAPQRTSRPSTPPRLEFSRIRPWLAESQDVNDFGYREFMNRLDSALEGLDTRPSPLAPTEREDNFAEASSHQHSLSDPPTLPPIFSEHSSDLFMSSRTEDEDFDPSRSIRRLPAHLQIIPSTLSSTYPSRDLRDVVPPSPVLHGLQQWFSDGVEEQPRPRQPASQPSTSGLPPLFSWGNSSSRSFDTPQSASSDASDSLFAFPPSYLDANRAGSSRSVTSNGAHSRLNRRTSSSREFLSQFSHFLSANEDSSESLVDLVSREDRPLPRLHRTSTRVGSSGARNPLSVQSLLRTRSRSRSLERIDQTEWPPQRHGWERDEERDRRNEDINQTLRSRGRTTIGEIERRRMSRGIFLSEEPSSNALRERISLQHRASDDTRHALSTDTDGGDLLDMWLSREPRSEGEASVTTMPLASGPTSLPHFSGTGAPIAIFGPPPSPPRASINSSNSTYPLNLSRNRARQARLELSNSLVAETAAELGSRSAHAEMLQQLSGHSRNDSRGREGGMEGDDPRAGQSYNPLYPFRHAVRDPIHGGVRVTLNQPRRPTIITSLAGNRPHQTLQEHSVSHENLGWREYPTSDEPWQRLLDQASASTAGTRYAARQASLNHEDRRATRSRLLSAMRYAQTNQGEGTSDTRSGVGNDDRLIQRPPSPAPARRSISTWNARSGLTPLTRPSSESMTAPGYLPHLYFDDETSPPREGSQRSRETSTLGAGIFDSRSSSIVDMINTIANTSENRRRDSADSVDSDWSLEYQDTPSLPSPDLGGVFDSAQLSVTDQAPQTGEFTALRRLHSQDRPQPSSFNIRGPRERGSHAHERSGFSTRLNSAEVAHSVQATPSVSRVQRPEQLPSPASPPWLSERLIYGLDYDRPRHERRELPTPRQLLGSNSYGPSPIQNDVPDNHYIDAGFDRMPPHAIPPLAFERTDDGPSLSRSRLDIYRQESTRNHANQSSHQHNSEDEPEPPRSLSRPIRTQLVHPSRPMNVPRERGGGLVDNTRIHHLLTRHVRLEGSRLDDLQPFVEPSSGSSSSSSSSSTSRQPQRQESGDSDGFRHAIDVLRRDGLSTTHSQQLVDLHNRNHSSSGIGNGSGARSRPWRVSPPPPGGRLAAEARESERILEMREFMDAREQLAAQYRRRQRLGQRQGGFGYGMRRGRPLGDYVRDEDFDESYESLLSLAATLGEVKPRATPDHVITSLETGLYSDWATVDGDQRCPICLDDYQPDDAVLKLRECTHWLHSDCLQQWLQGANTCPVCRKSVLPATSSPRSSQGEEARLTSQYQRRFRPGRQPTPGPSSRRDPPSPSNRGGSSFGSSGYFF